MNAREERRRGLNRMWKGNFGMTGRGMFGRQIRETAGWRHGCSKVVVVGSMICLDLPAKHLRIPSIYINESLQGCLLLSAGVCRGDI